MFKFTPDDLRSKSTPELRNLLREAFNALARCAPESAERPCALANIENVQAELVSRSVSPRRTP